MRLIIPVAIAIALTAAAAVSFVRSEQVAPAGVFPVRAGGLEIGAAWARATPPGATVGAAYATLANRGKADDRLLAVESPAAAEAGHR